MSGRALIITLFLVCCLSSATVEAKTTIRLALHWQPQAQFAGYFVALEKGFYRELGIDMVLLPGGTDSVPADRLSSGEAQFATMFLAAALERRAAGIPLVNVGQLVQRSSLLLLTRKKDRIDSIADLDGRRVAVWANEFPLQPWALFRQHDIAVALVPFSGSMDLFLKGAVTATMAMWYNEYHTVLASGYRESDLHPFFFKDTAYDFPEDGIYCLAETAARRSAIVDAVVMATLQGWHYAFAHEDEALAITKRWMQEANLPWSAAHQRWMLRTMQTLMTPADPHGSFGTLGRSAFQTVSRALLEAGFLDQLPNYEQFVRNGADDD